MKLTRILVVVVAMHLALAALVFCFSGCRTRGLEVIDEPTTSQIGGRVPPGPPSTSMPTIVTTSTVRPTPRIRTEDVRVPPTSTIRQTTTRRPSTQPGPGEQSYEVQSGDTIWSISQRYGLTMRDLLSRNGLAETDIIRVGQKIVLPPGARDVPAPSPTPTPVTPAPAMGAVTPGPATTAPAGAAATAPGGVYVVQPNDNLWTIARRHGTSIDAIRQANGLTTDLLQPGQELKIPGAAPTSAPPTPAPADPGPAGIAPAPAAPTGDAAPPTDAAPTGETENTFLEPGETLADVARKYNTTVEELLRLNGIQDASGLKEFDAIRVPVR